MEIERKVRGFLGEQSAEVAFVGEKEGNGVVGGAVGIAPRSIGARIPPMLARAPPPSEARASAPPDAVP